MTSALETIRAQHEPLLEDLRATGMNVTFYQRPPDRVRFVLGGMPGGSGLRLWPGLATTLVHHTSATHRQAVLSVREGAGALPASAILEHYHDYSGYCGADAPCTGLLAQAGGALRRRWNLAAGEGRVQVQSLTAVEPHVPGYQRYRVTGAVRLGAGTRHLLFGIDETAHFVAELPHAVGSVRDAHVALRPDEARARGVLRQGEWFLVPATGAERARLAARLDDPRTVVGERDLEPGSSHWAATSLRLDRQLFITTRLIDRRAGRHATLHLDGWYKVVRNLERTPRARGIRTRYWD